MSNLEKRVRTAAAEALKWHRVHYKNVPWTDKAAFAELDRKLIETGREFTEALREWLGIEYSGEDGSFDDPIDSAAYQLVCGAADARRFRDIERRLGNLEDQGRELDRRTTGQIFVGGPLQ